MWFVIKGKKENALFKGGVFVYNERMLLSVIIPSKDQSEKALKNIKGPLWRFLESAGIDYEILLVIDGSNAVNRKAAEAAMVMFPKQVRLIPYLPNKGKGHNVKRGFLEAKGDYVLFMDADLATDLNCFYDMKPHMEDYDCLFASRYIKGATLAKKQGLIRQIMSKGSRFLIRHTLSLHETIDFQCGFKMLRSDVAKEYAKVSLIDGFAFDTELLYFLKLNGYTALEVPCIWTDDPDSTVKGAFSSSLAFYKELRKIKKNKEHYLLKKEEKDAN